MDSLHTVEFTTLFMVSLNLSEISDKRRTNLVDEFSAAGTFH